MTEDPRTLAKLAWVRARLEFERGTPRHASEMVLAGAETVYDCDQEEAARMLIEVVRMAYFADEAPDLVRAAELIDAVPLPADHPLRPMLEASSILARLQPVEPGDQVPPASTRGACDPARAAGNDDRQPGHSQRVPVDDHRGRRRSVGPDRADARRGSRARPDRRLPHILLQHSQAALVAGRLREALRAANEGVQIAEDTGQLHSAANLRGVFARITAMTGDEDTCVALASEAIRRGAERHSSSVGLAVLALAVLELGFGRYTAALERLASLPPQLRRHPTFAYLSPPEGQRPRRAAANRNGRRRRSQPTCRGPRTATTPSCRRTCIAAAPCSDRTTKRSSLPGGDSPV